MSQAYSFIRGHLVAVLDVLLICVLRAMRTTTVTLHLETELLSEQNCVQTMHVRALGESSKHRVRPSCSSFMLALGQL